MFVRVRYFEIISEHAIVTDLERIDSAFRDELTLILREPLLTIGGERTQPIEFGIKSVGDHTPFAQMRRRLRRNRGVDELCLLIAKIFLPE